VKETDSIDNVFVVGWGRGHGVYDTIARLKREPWVVDAFREANPAGDEPEEVELSADHGYDFLPLKYGPDNATTPKFDINFPSNGEQVEVRRRLETFLTKLFDQLHISNDDVVHKQGFRYSFHIFAPADRLALNDSEHKGYWLKADVDFAFRKEGYLTNRKNAHDRMILSIEIRDAWLPKWPAGSQDPPPSEHTKKFHLAPDGSNKFQDFEILERLIKKIALAAEEDRYSK
jgi:hypothetical protein